MQPSARMVCSARVSRSAVVMPGWTAWRSVEMVMAVTRPARRMRSISSGDLKTITDASSARVGQVGQRRDGPIRDLVLDAIGVDLAEEPALRVELQQRRGALVVHLESPANGGLVVVAPLPQLMTARVADPRRLRRVEDLVVRPPAVRTDPSPGDALHRNLVVDDE